MLKRVKKPADTTVRIPERLKGLLVPMSKLKLWVKNPRKNEAAAKKLVPLIQAHGFNGVLMCTKDNVIRKGNTSYKAAQLLGMTHVPVAYVDFPSEDQAAAYGIADNRSGAFSEWDDGLLAELLGKESSLSEEDKARFSGFTAPEIEGLVNGWEDTVEPKEKKPRQRECPKCGHTWEE